MSTVDFASPSFRAASSDLTVSISPLGLVELADEEFEVHGPRLNRYSQNWAFYLGHHWAFRRELGEPQVTFNYVKAFADYITNFTFGRGVQMRSPKATEAIVPNILRRAWEVDNDKEAVLWEMGNQGGVSGDCFVKVAYEEPYYSGMDNSVEPAVPIPGVMQRFYPGRVRILPLNSAHCVDEQTEVLTRDGWKFHNEVAVGTEILTLDPKTDEIRWQPIYHVTKRRHSGPMHRWANERFDALTTDGHRWMTQNSRSGAHEFRVTSDLHDGNSSGARLVTAGGTPLAFAEIAKNTDEWVELLGWFVTEGSWNRTSGGFISQSEKVNPEKVARIRRVVEVLRQDGFHITELKAVEGRTQSWYLGSSVMSVLRDLCPDKQITPEFLCSLTFNQAQMFYNVLMLGDGHYRKTTKGEYWYQDDLGRVDGFQMLAAMLGKRTRARAAKGKSSYVTAYTNRLSSVREMERTVEEYDGMVWCPNVEATTWFARRNGTTYWTGNCFPEWHPHDRSRFLRFKLKYRFWGTSAEGTRQVFTYTELMTDEWIEEYVNDEMIDQRPNPLGRVAVVHIPNTLVSGSPWGLADIADVIPLNRLYNEIATDVADIINYHAAPVTVITGAKAGNLEKGPKKVWGGLPKDAQVFNLELGANLAAPQEFLDRLKVAMHEMTGVHETALGQAQPISNTSGVALAITFQPLMQRYQQKKIQYTLGLQRINELILMTLAVKEPLTLQYDESQAEAPLREGQLPVLDPADPITYQSVIHWPPPLPTDVLIKLQEIQQKMLVGLESKRGALRDLGKENPDATLMEIFEELLEDTEDQAVLDLRRAAYQAAIAALTGMTPDGQVIPPEPAPAGGVTSAGGSNVTSGGAGQQPGNVTTPSAAAGGLPGMEQGDMQRAVNEMVTRAYSPRVSMRKPDGDND